MGTDFSIRPVGVPVALPVVRPTSDATTGAVPTELPAPQAPSQPATAAAVANNLQASASNLTQNVVIDRAANTIVYQTIDAQTNQVISQFPDDAVLQARAYFRALADVQLDKSLYDQTA
jgi:uncharacterized FlaG/YvyC family protein